MEEDAQGKLLLKVLGHDGSCVQHLHMRSFCAHTIVDSCAHAGYLPCVHMAAATHRSKQVRAESARRTLAQHCIGALARAPMSRSCSTQQHHQRRTAKAPFLPGKRHPGQVLCMALHHLGLHRPHDLQQARASGRAL